MLVTSSLFYYQQSFLVLWRKYTLNGTNFFVVCLCFEFGPVWKFGIWYIYVFDKTSCVGMGKSLLKYVEWNNTSGFLCVGISDLFVCRSSKLDIVLDNGCLLMFWIRNSWKSFCFVEGWLYACIDGSFMCWDGEIFCRSIVFSFYHTFPIFKDPKGEACRKRQWEKEKMLVTSIFSFSHNVFYPIKTEITLFLQMLSI